MAKKRFRNNALSNQHRQSGRPLEFFQQYSGYPIEAGRNIICQYGYPEAPGFAEFYAVGNRVGLGKAVVNAPVDACWETNPEILDVISFDEKGEPKEVANSAFIKEFMKVVKSRKIQFWERLKGLDRKNRFGMYSGMMIVARDNQARTASEPLDRLVPGQLVKLVPFYEAQLIPIEYEQDIGSPNYGDVKMWQLIENAVNPKPGKQLSMEVHPSRIIIMSEGSEDGTIYGTPALQGCLYSIMDWEKARMASAEGIKRSNDQRGVISLKDGSNIPDPDSDVAELMDENIRDWYLGNESMLMVANADVTPFNATFHDPKNIAEMIEKEVAACARIPSTVLVGYQTGRLASTEDSLAFRSSMMQRRKGPCSEMIFDVIDRFIEIGLLPEPEGEIYIKWTDLTEPTQGDKLAIVERMANVNDKEYKSGNGAVFSTYEMRDACDYPAQVDTGEDLVGSEDNIQD